MITTIMDKHARQVIEDGKEAALRVLQHNARGPFRGLPRAAGWGYPEPYTRDLLISLPGIAVSGDKNLMQTSRKVLKILARNQTELGHIPSLVHDRENRGASDTTPLFLLACGIFRDVTGEHDFLHEAVLKALTWIRYQSPGNRLLVAQQPTSDWRDEQWTTGFALFVNTVVYSSLRLLDQHKWADGMLKEIKRFTIIPEINSRQSLEGFALRRKSYFAFWTYKIHSSERFDLLGNSLAILSGIASPSRAGAMIRWIEQECGKMQKKGDLAVALTPNFFPFILRSDQDWLPRYELYNRPGEYHNGGIWPFVCGFYIAALVAAGRFKLAEQKLLSLTGLLKKGRDSELDFGCNEWYKAQDGKPSGQDWQTWSAAMFLYASRCVETQHTPFFDKIRNHRAY
jgi:hypothetical protein